jgi:sulfite reductase alpha subunit-like flavoprotein
MCEDCLISFETKLKIQGKFNQYAVEKMKNNALSFFKQADQDVEQIKSELGQGITFVNEQGDVEKWGTEGKTNLLERIDDEYGKFKESVLKSIEKSANPTEKEPSSAS